MTAIQFLAEWALRSSILIAGGAALLFVLRVKDSSVRLAAWTAILAGSLLIPLMTSALPVLPLAITKRVPITVFTVPAAEQITVTPIESGETILPVYGKATPGGSTPEPSQLFDLRRLALIAYLFGAATMLCRLVAGLWGTLRLLKQSQATGMETEDIEIRTSHRIAAPVALEMIRAVIVLPVDWNEWDLSKLQAVLAHERSHIRRHDPAVQLLSAIHRTLLWFSPLSWFLHSQIVQVAEEASDDAAIALNQDRAFYAEMLLEFMQHPALRSSAMEVSMARCSHPEKRIHRILESSTISRGVTRWSVIAILSLSVPLVCVIAAARPQAAIPRGSKTAVIAPMESQITPVLISQVRQSPPVTVAPPRLEFEAASIRPAEPFTRAEPDEAEGHPPMPRVADRRES